MRAVDTNVLARLILVDDLAQFNVAKALLDEPVWVTQTVWLELGWLLGKKLKLDRAAVADFLSTLLSIDTVHTDNSDRLRWAIERYRIGADWADVMHLIMAEGIADTFATFDRDIARQVGESSLSIQTLR